MTRAPRRLLVLVALLLLVVVVAGLAAMTVAALPVALALALTFFAFVAALGSRVRRRSWRTGRTPHLPGGVDVVDRPCPAHLRWTTQWESTPPPEAVPATRGRLTAVLAEWGLVGEATEPTLLVVTELLSNAIDHGRAPVRLVVEHPDSWLHVEVHDAGPGQPQLRPHDPLQIRGRGLQMVEALSLQWGWHDDPSGKLVWADVPTEWPASASAGPAGR